MRINLGAALNRLAPALARARAGQLQGQFFGRQHAEEEARQKALDEFNRQRVIEQTLIQRENLRRQEDALQRQRDADAAATERARVSAAETARHNLEMEGASKARLDAYKNRPVAAPAMHYERRADGTIYRVDAEGVGRPVIDKDTGKPLKGRVPQERGTGGISPTQELSGARTDLNRAATNRRAAESAYRAMLAKRPRQGSYTILGTLPDTAAFQGAMQNWRADSSQTTEALEPARGEEAVAKRTLDDLLEQATGRPRPTPTPAVPSQPSQPTGFVPQGPPLPKDLSTQSSLPPLSDAQRMRAARDPGFKQFLQSKGYTFP